MPMPTTTSCGAARRHSGTFTSMHAAPDVAMGIGSTYPIPANERMPAAKAEGAGTTRGVRHRTT